MAWIESHTVLIRHRKTISMALELKIKPVQLVGHLHALWHCVMEQAEDGDISKWENGFIASASCWDGDPDVFVTALKKNRWLDNGLLHDWLDYAGRYLDAKYRSSKPEILARIRVKYNGSQTHNRRKSDFRPTKDGPPTNLPNLPEITKPTKPTTYSVEFLEFWKVYPYKTAKDKAWTAWQKLTPPLTDCIKTLAWQIKTNGWTKENGKYIPMPVTWLNGGRWKDEPVRATTAGGAAPIPGKYDGMGEKV
mgnify:FL=1